MLSSAAARRTLAHELIGHCGSQTSFALVLRCHAAQGAAGASSAGGPGGGAALGLAAVLGAYTASVVAAAALLPPHQLPYGIGAVPDALRWPVALPAGLAGDGAVWGWTLRLWWMEVGGRKEGWSREREGRADADDARRYAEVPTRELGNS